METVNEDSFEDEKDFDEFDLSYSPFIEIYTLDLESPISNTLKFESSSFRKVTIYDNNGSKLKENILEKEKVKLESLSCNGFKSNYDIANEMRSTDENSQTILPRIIKPYINPLSIDNIDGMTINEKGKNYKTFSDSDKREKHSKSFKHDIVGDRDCMSKFKETVIHTFKFEVEDNYNKQKDSDEKALEPEEQTRTSGKSRLDDTVELKMEEIICENSEEYTNNTFKSQSRIDDAVELKMEKMFDENSTDDIHKSRDRPDNMGDIICDNNMDYTFALELNVKEIICEEYTDDTPKSKDLNFTKNINKNVIDNPINCCKLSDKNNNKNITEDSDILCLDDCHKVDAYTESLDVKEEIFSNCNPSLKRKNQTYNEIEIVYQDIKRKRKVKKKTKNEDVSLQVNTPLKQCGIKNITADDVQESKVRIKNQSISSRSKTNEDVIQKVHMPFEPLSDIKSIKSEDGQESRVGIKKQTTSSRSKTIKNVNDKSQKKNEELSRSKDIKSLDKELKIQNEVSHHLESVKSEDGQDSKGCSQDQSRTTRSKNYKVLGNMLLKNANEDIVIIEAPTRSIDLIDITTDEQSNRPLSSHNNEIELFNMEESREKSAKIKIACPKLEDMERIRVSGEQMEKYIKLPMFSKVVIGCFVKLKVYEPSGVFFIKMTDITDVVEMDSYYQFGGIRTNAGIKIRSRVYNQIFPLNNIIDYKFLRHEFEEWLEECFQNNDQIPTIEYILGKEKEIIEMDKYERAMNDDPFCVGNQISCDISSSYWIKIENETKFYCSLCEKAISQNSNAKQVLLHIVNRRHSLKAATSLEYENILKDGYIIKTLTYHEAFSTALQKIILNTRIFFKCPSCEMNVNTVEKLVRHLKNDCYENDDIIKKSLGNLLETILEMITKIVNADKKPERSQDKIGENTQVMITKSKKADKKPESAKDKMVENTKEEISKSITEVPMFFKLISNSKNNSPNESFCRFFNKKVGCKNRSCLFVHKCSECFYEHPQFECRNNKSMNDKTKKSQTASVCKFFNEKVGCKNRSCLLLHKCSECFDEHPNFECRKNKPIKVRSKTKDTKEKNMQELERILAEDNLSLAKKKKSHPSVSNKDTSNPLYDNRIDTALKIGIISVDANGMRYICNVCNCDMQGKPSIKCHLGGKKHRRTLRSKNSDESRKAMENQPIILSKQNQKGKETRSLNLSKKNQEVKNIQPLMSDKVHSSRRPGLLGEFSTSHFRPHPYTPYTSNPVFDNYKFNTHYNYSVMDSYPSFNRNTNNLFNKKPNILDNLEQARLREYYRYNEPNPYINLEKTHSREYFKYNEPNMNKDNLEQIYIREHFRYNESIMDNGTLEQNHPREHFKYNKHHSYFIDPVGRPNNIMRLPPGRWKNHYTREEIIIEQFT